MQELIMTNVNHTLPQFNTKVYTLVNQKELQDLQRENPNTITLGQAPLIGVNPALPKEKGTWVNLDMSELSEILQKRYQSPEDLADGFTQSLVNYSKRNYAILLSGLAGLLAMGLTKSSFPKTIRLIKMPALFLGIGAYFLNTTISSDLLDRKLKYIQMKPFLDAQHQKSL